MSSRFRNSVERGLEQFRQAAGADEDRGQFFLGDEHAAIIMMRGDRLSRFPDQELLAGSQSTQKGFEFLARASLPVSVKGAGAVPGVSSVLIVLSSSAWCFHSAAWAPTKRGQTKLSYFMLAKLSMRSRARRAWWACVHRQRYGSLRFPHRGFRAPRGDAASDTEHRRADANAGSSEMTLWFFQFLADR